MKKLFVLFVVVLLCGCSMWHRSRENNENCEKYRALEVFQTLDDGALARVYNKTMVIFIPKEVDDTLYDEKIIKPSYDKCFVMNGTYKYDTVRTKDSPSKQKTVPIINIADRF